MLSLRQLFGGLGDNASFVAELGAALRDLDTQGAKATLRMYLSQRSL